MRRGIHIPKSSAQRKLVAEQQASPVQLGKHPPQTGVSPIVQRKARTTNYSSPPIQLARHRIHPQSGQVPNAAWTYLGNEGVYQVYDDGQAGADQTYDPPGGIPAAEQRREASRAARRQTSLQNPHTPTEHALAPHAQTGQPLLMNPHVLALGADNSHSTALRDRINALRAQNIHPTYLTGDLLNQGTEYGRLRNPKDSNSAFIRHFAPEADRIHVAGGQNLMDALANANPKARRRAVAILARERRTAAARTRGRRGPYGTVEEVRDILEADLHDWDDGQQAFIRR